MINVFWVLVNHCKLMFVCRKITIRKYTTIITSIERYAPNRNSHIRIPNTKKILKLIHRFTLRNNIPKLEIFEASLHHHTFHLVFLLPAMVFSNYSYY